MVERFVEHGTEVEVKKQGQETNNQAFEWSFAFPVDSKESKRLEKTAVDRHIMSAYDPSGLYEADYAEQTNEMIAATRADKKMTPAKAVKHLELARHFNVQPMIAPLEEQVVKPLVDNRIAENNAKLAKEAEESQDPAVKQKKLANLDVRQAAKEKSFRNQLQSTAEKESKELNKLFGDSWTVRNENYLITEEAPREVSEDTAKAVGAIVAKPLVTTRSVEALEQDIAEENRAVASNESGPVEESVTERFDDVEVDKKTINAAELSGGVALSKVVETISAIEQAPKKRRGLLSRASDKLLSIGVKISNRNVNKSPEEIKSRRKKIVAAGVGVLAVGVTALLLKDHGHDFGLSGLFGQGHEGNASDAHQATGTISGSEHGSSSGTVFGPEQPDVTTVQPSAPVIEAPAPVTSNFIEGSKEHVQHFSLQSGDTIWGHVEDTVRNNHPNLSETQIQIKTHQEVSNVLNQTGQNWDTARSLPINWSTKG